MYNIFLYVHILFSPLRTFGNLNHEKSIIWIFRKMDPLQVASLQSSSRKEGILVPQKTFWNVGFHGYWISGCKKKSFGLVRWRVFTHEVGRVGIYGCWMLRCKCVLFFTEAWTYHSRPCSKKTGLFSDAYIYILIPYLQQLNWCLVGCFSLVASAQDWWIYIDSRCTTYRELSVEGWEQHRQHRR